MRWGHLPQDLLHHVPYTPAGPHIPRQHESRTFRR